MEMENRRTKSNGLVSQIHRSKMHGIQRILDDILIQNQSVLAFTSVESKENGVCGHGLTKLGPDLRLYAFGRALVSSSIPPPSTTVTHI